MWSKQLQLVLLGIVLIATVKYAESIFVTQDQWNQFKSDFPKTYGSVAAENAARFNYAYNKASIDRHNVYANRGVYSYFLKPTQFSDMRFVQFSAQFPQTTLAQALPGTAPPTIAGTVPEVYDPQVNIGLTTTVENQGYVCNSGWAYAAAKSVEMLQASTSGPLAGVSLSAQSLIDCAGSGRGCSSQVPHTAFEFLSEWQQSLYPASNYANVNTAAEPGMCLRLLPAPANVVNVANFARIADGRDDLLQQYVGNGMPVVVEFDPTSFEFMHYAGGVFQQPATRGGSHFMVVVGYGRNATSNLDYWKVLNSFGNRWGNDGYFYINRNNPKALTKSAVFPTELA